MTTWTGQLKNSASWTGQSKPSAKASAGQYYGFGAFTYTGGQSLSGSTSWSGQAKPTSSWTGQTKS